MSTRIYAITASIALCLGVAGCGGGGGSTPAPITPTVAITGTAASGGALNGLVVIKDSSSPAKTANTNTDSSGTYSFTTAQLSGMTPPYMLQITHEVAGVEYYLTSAATGSDLASGTATINITPLTDLIVANLAQDIASNVFSNGNFSSILTPAALAAGATSLANQLQPMLAAAGVTGAVDLLHDSFTANTGTGLDGVLDALKVTVDPATKTAIITNRLNNTSITNDLTSTSNTEQISTTGDVPLTDLQAITKGFNDFSALMATAPAADAPALLAFFDQANFLQDGRNLATFLQQITTNPTVVGGFLSFSNISLDSVPTWVSTVPSGATAYRVHFRVMLNKAPNSREAFIIYKSTTGDWLLLGNQTIAKTRINAMETVSYSTNTSGTPVYCTGLEPSVSIKGGSANISYAIVTGPALPANGLLLFNDGTNNEDFMIADPSAAYNGTATTAMSSNSSNCGFNSLYPLTDAQIAGISTNLASGTNPGRYAFKLYDDNGTPSDMTDDQLLATYGPTLASAPLLSTQVNASLFPTIDPTQYMSAMQTVLAYANGSAPQSFTLTWTAPAASNLYASSSWMWLSNTTVQPQAFQNVSTDLAATATSATAAIPLLAGANNVGTTIEYNDAAFRVYWTGGFYQQ